MVDIDQLFDQKLFVPTFIAWKHQYTLKSTLYGISMFIIDPKRRGERERVSESSPESAR
jgi:hypothetical protein